MEKSFNPKEYIRYLGKELVNEFEKSGLTTHTHAVGGGRESSARSKLKLILPAGIGIGSGFVIDSFGNTSKQCDIIIYEENFAMQFIINDDYANAYYNCESVIAVGEVKSDASLDDVRDSINKLVEIKKLRRKNDNGYHSRKYFSSLTITDNITGEIIPYNSDNDAKAQIYTFLLCKTLKTNIDGIIKSLNEKCNEQYMYVNRIISTDGDYFSYLKHKNNQYNNLPSRIGADNMYNLKDNKYSFNYFVSDLMDFISIGDTVPLNYKDYLNISLSIDDLKEIKPL